MITTQFQARATDPSRIPHGDPYSTSSSKNGTGAKASAPSTPLPLHTPRGSGAKALDLLLAGAAAELSTVSGRAAT